MAEFETKPAAIRSAELPNARHERFCCEYIIDLNATKAAIRAGYSRRTARSIGNRLLTNDNIHARVGELLDAVKSEKIADAVEVLEYLTAVMRGEAQEEVFAFNQFGQPVHAKKAVGGREQIKAAELLARRYGLLTDNVNMAGAVVQIIDDMKTKHPIKEIENNE